VDSFKKNISGFLDNKFCDAVTRHYSELGIKDLSKNGDLKDAVDHINQIILEKTVSYIQENPVLRSLDIFETKSEILRWVHQVAYNYGGVKFGSALDCRTFTLQLQPQILFHESEHPFIVKVAEDSFTSSRNFNDPGTSIEFIIHLGGDRSLVEFDRSGEKIEMAKGDAIILPAIWTHDYKISSNVESYFLINTIAFDESKYQIMDF